MLCRLTCSIFSLKCRLQSCKWSRSKNRNLQSLKRCTSLGMDIWSSETWQHPVCALNYSIQVSWKEKKQLPSFAVCTIYMLRCICGAFSFMVKTRDAGNNSQLRVLRSHKIEGFVFFPMIWMGRIIYLMVFNVLHHGKSYSDMNFSPCLEKHPLMQEILSAHRAEIQWKMVPWLHGFSNASSLAPRLPVSVVKTKNSGSSGCWEVRLWKDLCFLYSFEWWALFIW